MLAITKPASWPSVWSTQAEFELQQKINNLPNYAPAGFGAAQPASWPTLWTGAQPTPASWPKNWSTESEFDLQSRLSRLPFYASPIQAMRVAPAGLGAAGLGADSISDLLSKGSQILAKAGPYLDTVLQFVQDPALPQVIDRVKLIRTLSAGPAPTTPAAAPTAPTGFNLQRTLPVLDAVIWYQKHRWAPYAIGAGVVAILGGIGFGIGRATKKCKTGAVGRRYRRKR